VISQVYAIYDTKAASFSLPLFAPNEAVARRIFHDVVNSPRSTYNMHPHDYSLVSLGTYDDETGRHDDLDNAITICHGFEVLEPKKETQLDLVDHISKITNKAGGSK